MKTRIYFLDNLRTVMIFLVVLLHAGIVYEPILENVWIVSDPVKNNSIVLIGMYLDIFVMFIMFFISGYFISQSLKGKSAWEFILSKFKRIMVPFIVAVFTLIPIFKVIFLYSRGLPQQEWYTYFHLFQRVGSDMHFFADNPTQSWLWFLPVLFIFQVAYLVLSRTGMLSFRIKIQHGVILTFVLGLVYCMTISELGLSGWFDNILLHFQRERLLVYFMIFLLGSLCSKEKVFDKTLDKKVYLASNIVLPIALTIFTVAGINLFYNIIEPGRNYFFISSMADRTFYYASLLLSMFSFLHIFIYSFKKWFDKGGALINEMSRNSYAVYIIHVIMIGILALGLLNVSLPAYPKFILVTILTFVLSNLLISSYKRVFGNFFSSNWISAATVAVSVVLSVVVYAQNESPEEVLAEEAIMNQDITAPSVSLHMAIIQGDNDAVRQHLKAGTDINLKEPTVGSTPLITASLFGNTEAAIILIDAGADINYQNNDGSTALHTAAFFCNTDIVMYLLDHGADINIRNKSGSTALESVQAPFELVEGIYDFFKNTLGPLGLELDYESIKATRPKISEIISNSH